MVQNNDYCYKYHNILYRYTYIFFNISNKSYLYSTTVIFLTNSSFHETKLNQKVKREISFVYLFEWSTLERSNFCLECLSI